MTHPPQSRTSHQVVVIGGGFGGLNTVRGLKHAPVQVKLIDKRNFHLFQPLLYQVAGGALSPANIASPLRHVFSRQKNCQVLLGEVHRIDPEARIVFTDDAQVRYDTLVVAAGSTHSYFGRNDWEPLAPGLKTVEDATQIRTRILTAFEEAENEPDPEVRRRLLTFVIVGGGATGVELAGALADISRLSLKDDFRQINPADSQIILVEGADRILTPFPPELSNHAKEFLERRGVQVRAHAKVIDIQPDHVLVKVGDKDEIITTKTVLWAAGVQAAPLGRQIAEATGAKLDRSGRVQVEPDLSLPGHPEIFVIGDLATYHHQGERPLPGVAPVAIQQGQYVARLIAARLRGGPLPVFRYHDKGNLATIGKWSAVADFGWFKLSGFFAWVLWLLVHLMYITGFRNRLLVLIQWAWNFLTNDRSARLITGESTTAPQENQSPNSSYDRSTS
ncbi:NAD(P)/FAD-dependent oxidoreductase [Planctomicrobium sp. SH661]|uniref:NAD(P)/FAD-dependent oxidoreductase n=1 Tax=Planctomicrobium sp. SH661 TaxID=3448124 RepID=UPI003F5ADE6E